MGLPRIVHEFAMLAHSESQIRARPANEIDERCNGGTIPPLLTDHHSSLLSTGAVFARELCSGCHGGFFSLRFMHVNTMKQRANSGLLRQENGFVLIAIMWLAMDNLRFF